jgi:hypothetical protein
MHEAPEAGRTRVGGRGQRVMSDNGRWAPMRPCDAMGAHVACTLHLTPATRSQRRLLRQD